MTSRKCSAKDFIFKEEIGHGSYSTVYKAFDKRNIKTTYAIKVCSKSHIIKEGKVKYVTIEKNTLNLLARANHPGIVKLYYTFHDEQNLYFVLDFAPGGELLSLLHKFGVFNEKWSKHFTVQLIDTLSYIHSQGVIHRDLKPENVLLDKDGRLMITDFGAALSNNNTKNPTDQSSNDIINNSSSFVGTAEYVSPELLLYNQCSYGSDIWALGCMIFQFFEGHPPFRGENELKTFEKIVALDYSWGNNNNKNKTINKTNDLPPTYVIDLVKKILVINTKDRLTLNDIKQNFWFKDINWNDKSAIWKGVWQLPQEGSASAIRTNNQASSIKVHTSSYQRMIPDRQLHVIDTPVKNITITKQKRKKPTKVSNTTSSIVEWRKKLGISTNTNTNKSSQSIDLTTDIDNINNDIIIPTRKVSANNNKHNSNTSIPNGNSNKVPSKKNILMPVENRKDKIGTSSNNATPQQFNEMQNVPPTNISQRPISKIYQNKQATIPSYSKTKFSTLNIFKQGIAFIQEIPFKQDGPGMSFKSYHQIDNDIITSFVSDHHSELKCLDSEYKMLILKKNGSLLYDILIPGTSEIDEQFMVNIGDSELSVYDFEFDEENRTGFLILEKYKHKIWFISLPEKKMIIPKDKEVNEKETWVDCFFRVRQSIENQLEDSDSKNKTDENSKDIQKALEDTRTKLNNITINENKNKISIIKTTSTTLVNGIDKATGRIAVRKTSGENHSNKIHITKPSSNATIMGHNKSASISNALPIHINQPKQRQSSTGSAKSRPMSHNPISSPPVSLPSTLRGGISTTKNPQSAFLSSSVSSSLSPPTLPANSLPSSYDKKRLFSPPIRSKQVKVESHGFMNINTRPTSPVNNSITPTSPSLLPTSPLFPPKKYTAPKDMVISSSRYEVIHTLSSPNSQDQTVASSGASAAFKSLQRKRL